MSLPSAPPDLYNTFHTRAPTAALRPSGGIPRRYQVKRLGGGWPSHAQGDTFRRCHFANRGYLRGHAASLPSDRCPKPSRLKKSWTKSRSTPQSRTPIGTRASLAEHESACSPPTGCPRTAVGGSSARPTPTPMHASLKALSTQLGSKVGLAAASPRPGRSTPTRSPVPRSSRRSTNRVRNRRSVGKSF